MSLPPSIRTVAVSQRGHGDSDKPATGYRVQGFAADVVHLLDSLHIERAVLAGHSGSWLVTRRVAIDRPDRVAGLVLEASPTTLRGHAGLAAFVASLAALVDPIDPGFARAVVVDTHRPSSALRAGARVAGDVRGAAELRRHGRARSHHRPEMLIWGDADGLVPHEMQEQLKGRIRSAELLVYSGLGDTPRWEDAWRFASDVAAFVEQLAPG